MRCIIDQRCDGQLLREYLLRTLGFSHRLLTRLKKAEGGILLNGTPVTVRATLKEGDVLLLATEDEGSSPCGRVAVGSSLPVVLYEDDHILVCNKPYGMPTHPSHGHLDDTLANAVALYETMQGRPSFVFRPINRLDRDTSGVVLIARSQLAAARLSRAMSEGAFQKQYFAILEGVPDCRGGEITAAIRRAQESIITREICDSGLPGAHDARTKYQVVLRWSYQDRERCLVRALPFTGRTHQLRLHFAHVGAPIAGDSLYGPAFCDPTAPTRQALHAYSLTFPHPITQKRMTVLAPLCEDMRALLPTH